MLTSNTILPLDKFGDKGFILRLLSEDSKDTWSNERSFKEFIDQEASSSVVSLVRKVPPVAGDRACSS
ncbi:hypothetical protein N6H14_05560 [Paenibacillus sp. CC-CFT747]|nr:hypothetical protein N6H14_05560 [Paenibacillus sp. CC-CFT747]